MNSLALSALFLAAGFSFTWRLAVRKNNYSFVDVAWALSFTPVALLHAAGAAGWPVRRTALAALIALWSLRLGVHLWRRAARHHPEEDPRYALLRDRWPQRRERNFLAFFLAQALLVWLLMLPAWLICRNPAPRFEAPEIVGLLVWAVALLGEAIADHQLSRFKEKNPDPLAVCNSGLWRFSRHPNYFFQSLLWWGLFLMALPAPWGWTALLAPLGMLFFLLKVTGVPLTEELSLRKRGAAYRRYQDTTSRFLPLPPKSTSRTDSE